MSLRCRLFGHEYVPVEYEDPNDPFGTHYVSRVVCIRCRSNVHIEWDGEEVDDAWE